MNFNAHIIVHLFHIFLVGPLFLYVGIETTTIPKIMFPILLGLGAFLIAYHAYLAYKKTMDGKSAWVNYIHALIIGPLLVYIGYTGKDTSRKFFEILLMLGMAAIGYHGFYLVKSM
jgi:Na+-transporting methylmalonyl-CoA/oxaloacetate decarboxylase beta subunit